MWSGCIVEYYSVLKMEILTDAATWTLRAIYLSSINWLLIWNDFTCMSSQIYGDRKWNGKFQGLGRERKSHYLVGTEFHFGKWERSGDGWWGWLHDVNCLMPEVSHLMWLRSSLSSMSLTGRKEGTSLEMQGIGLGASLPPAPPPWAFCLWTEPHPG